MKLTITLDLNTAAFVDEGTGEVDRILRELCDRLPEALEKTNGDLNLHDREGNHVGTARID